VHYGIDPAGVPLLRTWLRIVHRAAQPFARHGVPPTVLTVCGGVFALVAVPVAAPGRAGRSAGALALVLGSVLCDALDGAVAVQTGRVTLAGARADRATDRLSDVAFAAMLRRCGAPRGLAAAAGTLGLGVELFREVRGGRVRSVITVGERPTRTVCAALALASAAVTPAAWPAAVCAAVDAAAGAVALGQLLRAARA
jgi:CDP-diacylglycerol--glycerol-3-phosphate 3-phosphatidyltransferase